MHGSYARQPIGTEVVLQHARGMLRFGEGRFDKALAEFARAQSLERLLASEHVFTVDVRARALHVAASSFRISRTPARALSRRRSCGCC
jgi:hypothetical protein